MSDFKDKIQQQCKMFSVSTGIEVDYIPINSRQSLCEICEKLHFKGCSQLSEKSVTIANQLRCGYCFMCPLGFAIFCSPVRDKNNLVGGYFSAPLMLDDMCSYQDDICLHNAHCDTALLSEILQGLKSVSCERLRYLTELLYLASCDFDAENAVNDYLVQQQNSSNKEINEQIQQLKIDNNMVDNRMFVEMENKLIQAITDKDYNTSRHILNKLLGNVFYSFGNNLMALKLKCIEIITLISRTHNNGLQSFAFSKTATEKIFSLDNYYTLCDYLNNALKQFFSLAEDDSPLTQTIANAKRYIKENICELLSLKDVADYVYLSPAYFSRIFKLQTGTTFSQYVMDCKIDEVKKLLSSTNLSVVEIANKLQFADQSYLAKVFKTKTGKTPLAWKNSTLQ